MKTLEEMETNMRLDDLKQKGGVSEEKKVKKPALAVEPIQLELISTDIDRLYSQIYAYFSVSNTALVVHDKGHTYSSLFFFTQ